MIVCKRWIGKKAYPLDGTPVYKYRGYYLFGIIPLAIIREKN